MEEGKVVDAIALLRSLAVTANNTIMKGSFTGDAILEAGALMDDCHKILELLDREENE